MSANIRQFIFNMQAELKFIHDTLLGNSLFNLFEKGKSSLPGPPGFSRKAGRSQTRGISGLAGFH